MTTDLHEARPDGTKARPIPAPGTAGVLRRRPPLPTGRAVVGGLLVAVALVGTWWTASGAGRETSTAYLVAARDVAPGHRLTRSDLAWSKLDLPATQRRHVFSDPASVVGTVAVAPIEEDELVQSSGLVVSSGRRPARELSFVVEAAWAVGGTLRAGDRVDVLVTYGDGATSETRRVLSGTTIRRVDGGDEERLGTARTQTITVAISDPKLVNAATNAARAGTVTVVRATDTDAADDGGTYRPPAGTAASDGDQAAEPTTTTTKRRGG